MRIFDLDDRLIEFTCRMIDVVEALPNTKAGNYIGSQLIKSCHSPTFNYGEVQAAESLNDFIHKLSICQKELKECRTALKIIIRKQLIRPVERLFNLYKETEELIAIIGKSLKTSKKKKQEKEKNDPAIGDKANVIH